jgi:hypothetical protein
MAVQHYDEEEKRRIHGFTLGRAVSIAQSRIVRWFFLLEEEGPQLPVDSEDVPTSVIVSNLMHWGMPIETDILVRLMAIFGPQAPPHHLEVLNAAY